MPALWALNALLAVLAVLMATGPGRKNHWETAHREHMLASGEWRRCPLCDEVIQRDASLCRHCGRPIKKATRLTGL